MKNKLDQLQEISDIQSSDDIWNFDPYMHGLANGLILALSILKDHNPEFLTSPSETWSYELANEVFKIKELPISEKKKITKHNGLYLVPKNEGE